MSEVHLERLKFFGDKITRDPELLAKTIKDSSGSIIRVDSFCNIAFARIAFGTMGYESFHELTANQIYDHLWQLWDPILPDQAHKLAEDGFFVAAARKDKPHGHVAVVAPGPMVYSGKWKIEVPLVYNVGGNKKNGESMNGIIGANYAFANPPDFFRRAKYG